MFSPAARTAGGCQDGSWIQLGTGGAAFEDEPHWVRTQRHPIVLQNFGYLLPQMESMGIHRRQSEEATTALLRLRKARNQVATVQISFGEVESEVESKEPSVRYCVRETELGPAEGEKAKTPEVH